MILQDIVALAKAGYTPKQVKELLEMVETSPAVKEAKVEDVVDKATGSETKKPEEIFCTEISSHSEHTKKEE